MTERRWDNPQMAFSRLSALFFVLAAIAAGTIFFGVYWFRDTLWSGLISAYELFSDRDQITDFISAFGLNAPLAFIGVQILQVLLAPIPGEASGFIGGYLFGVIPGLLYSSIGLTIGSCLNFAVGRFVGKRYIRRLIPPVQLEKMDRLVRRQGVIALFLLFVFPGFPKDYLCYFLGVSAIPAKVFLILAAVGRIPGTLLLSLQGAFLFDKMYAWFALVMAGCLFLAVWAYRCRERLYAWLEKINGS
jgi:uncharacterized membrane protein YdjX (TVP38/TMEM64 family)